MMRSSAWVLAAVSVVSMLGCAARHQNSGSDDGTAAAGDDAAQVESDSESFGSMFAASDGNGGLTASSFSGGGLVTEGLPASNNFPNLSPAGCVTETQDAASKTNTYVFDNCTGPWGFVHLKGTVTVQWDVVSPTELKLTYAATNFEINKANIAQWNATADITANGNDRDMVWHGQFNGTTGNGRTFQRVNDKDIKWTVGAQCISIDGQSTGSVTGKNLTTKVITYKRCVAECPEADSEINIHNDDNGNDVDVKFQGGDKADITFTNGANGNTLSLDIGLACGG